MQHPYASSSGFHGGGESGLYTTSQGRATVTAHVDLSTMRRHREAPADNEEILFPGQVDSKTYQVNPGEIVFSIMQHRQDANMDMFAPTTYRGGQSLPRVSILNGFRVARDLGMGMGRGPSITEKRQGIYELINVTGLALNTGVIEQQNRQPGPHYFQVTVAGGAEPTVIGTGGCQAGETLHWMVPLNNERHPERWTLELVSESVFYDTILSDEVIAEATRGRPVSPLAQMVAEVLGSDGMMGGGARYTVDYKQNFQRKRELLNTFGQKTLLGKALQSARAGDRITMTLGGHCV